MRTSKNLVIIGLVVLVAVFLAAPSAFAKKQLADDELDLITAAGEPTVVQTGIGTISFSDDYTPTLTFDNNSQNALQGLIVNNIVGENQVASALNIAAVDFINGVPSQTNSITQSWGATKDLSAAIIEPVTATVAGVTAAASATASAVGGIQTAALEQAAAAGFCGAADEVKCAANKQLNVQAQGLIQKQGDVIATSAASTSTSPGSVAISAPMMGILSAYADQIVDTDIGDIFFARQQASVLAFDNGSQSNLAALVLNNVSGVNQVANAINIMGSAVTLSPLGIAAGTQYFSDAAQSNTIVQYRGTPLSRPDFVPVAIGPVAVK